MSVKQVYVALCETCNTYMDYWGFTAYDAEDELAQHVAEMHD